MDLLKNCSKTPRVGVGLKTFLSRVGAAVVVVDLLLPNKAFPYLMCGRFPPTHNVFSLINILVKPQMIKHATNFMNFKPTAHVGAGPGAGPISGCWLA